MRFTTETPRHGDEDLVEAPRELDPLTREIIGGAIEVHKVLGPGLLESMYEECLAIELADRGLSVERQVMVPLEFKGRKIEPGYRIDLFVEGLVVLELKAVERVLPVHEAQLLTYLKLTGVRLGLLLNFHVPVMKDGIFRRAL